MKALITDYSWPDIDLETRVLAAAEVDVVTPEGPALEELVELSRTGVDAIMTCFAQVPAEVIGASEKLQVVARYGVGLDNINVAAATDRGVIVTNVPDYCVDEVAEHALALLLALRRGVCGYRDAVRAGDWRLATGKPLYRVRGQTLGLVGLGAIGQALARRARGLGLDVCAFDRRHPAGATVEGVRIVDLDSLLATSDVVSLHVPLTESTRHLIGTRELALMRPDAHLVNTARGGLVNLAALDAALEARSIAGAGLDVVDPEPLVDHPLLERSNVIITPHVSFYSEDSVQALQQRAAGSVVAVLSGRMPENVVNPEVLRLGRWSHLAEGDRRSAGEA